MTSRSRQPSPTSAALAARASRSERLSTPPVRAARPDIAEPHHADHHQENITMSTPDPFNTVAAPPAPPLPPVARSAPAGGADDDGSAAGPERPSDVGMALAELLRHVKGKEREAIRELLMRSLAHRSPDMLRHQRLGLLVELIARGEEPTRDRYDAECRLRELERRPGEPDWPKSTALSDAYGGLWGRAVHMAQRLADGDRSVPSTMRHQFKEQVPYRRDEALAGVETVAVALGAWPREGEYTMWAIDARRRARARDGGEDPRLPEVTVLCRLFGSYEEALRLAVMRAAHNGRAVSDADEQRRRAREEAGPRRRRRR